MSQPAPSTETRTEPGSRWRELAPERRAELRGLIEAALRAPNGDNTQPWAFSPHPAGFDVHLVPERSASVFDPDDLASRMALGALLETARLAGGPVGLRVSWQLDPEPGMRHCWARVAIARGEPATEDLASAIDRRESNRLPFEETPLTAAEQSGLAGEARTPVGVRLITDRRHVESVAAMVGRAEIVRVENREAHENLHRWLRWTPAEAAATRDGLDVRTLGLTPHERWSLRLMKPWWFMSALRPLAAPLMTHHAREGVMRSGALIALSVRELDRASAVSVGITMQRVWLRATLLGLAMSPLAALPLFYQQVVRGHPAFAHRADELTRLQGELEGLAGLGPGERVAMLLRTGHATPTPVRSLRRNVEDCLL